MPNSMPDDQNTEPYVDLLAASSRAYKDRSLVGTAQALFTVSSALFGPLMAWVNPDYEVWGAIWAVFVLIIDEVLLEPLKEDKTKTGSKIQELFDTKLFRLPWNNMKCGPPPPTETLDELMRRYKAKHSGRSGNPNWYPANIGEVSLAFARLICQRANLVWDGGLRKNYAMLLKVVMILMGMGILVSGVAMGMTTDKFLLSIVVPILPAMRRCFAEHKKQVTWVAENERLTGYLETLWTNSLKAPRMTDLEFVQESRRLQDETFERRRRAPTVPSFLHHWFKDEYQRQMEAAAREFVKHVVEVEDPEAAADGQTAVISSAKTVALPELPPPTCSPQTESEGPDPDPQPA